MTRQFWHRVLGVGVLVVLIVVTAACSGPGPDEAVGPESEDVTRTIKVYESPT